MSTLSNLIRPHHVSLLKRPLTVQSFFHSLEDRVDPYYEFDGLPSHRGVIAPRFNVTETETVYLLDGELPGIEEKNQITVEWLQNQILTVQGVIKPSDTETAADPFTEKGLHNDLPPPPAEHIELPKPVHAIEIEAMAQTPVYTYPRRILSERRLGGFERSFTFPMEVNPDGMKASLTNGLLRIVVPKKKDAVSESRRIRVQ